MYVRAAVSLIKLRYIRAGDSPLADLSEATC